ncbi:hypothetical protein B0O99DRAFT_625189 [Bisporella sp. PMI_857]|nr:hypothetical protein B0O99DRAFT_625189 [Bisporella sp. PMI_857]
MELAMNTIVLCIAEVYLATSASIYHHKVLIIKPEAVHEKNDQEVMVGGLQSLLTGCGRLIPCSTLDHHRQGLPKLFFISGFQVINNHRSRIPF